MSLLSILKTQPLWRGDSRQRGQRLASGSARVLAPYSSGGGHPVPTSGPRHRAYPHRGCFGPARPHGADGGDCR